MSHGRHYNKGYRGEIKRARERRHRRGGRMKPIYLDNNATSAVAPEVIEEMLPYLKELYGNPSSMHTFGGQLHRKIEEAREKVAALIGAAPEEIIFTSCGTESDNTALMSAMESYPHKRHVITTRVEHPAVLNFSKH